MPIALVILGLVMVVSGVKNTYGDLGAQLKADMTGAGNFGYWALSIGAIGAVGYSDTLRPFSNAALALVLVALLLANRGFFARLKEAIDAGPLSTPARDAPSVKSDNTAGPSTLPKVAGLDLSTLSLAIAEEFAP